MEKTIAHGKIILVGEHAVAYKRPAIAIPLRAVATTAKIKESNELTIKSEFGISSNTSSILEHTGLLKMLKAFFKDNKIENKLISIEIETTSPIKSGLGTSAQVALSLITELANYYKKTLKKKQLFNYVQIAELHHHHNCSGIDAMTIIENKPLFYKTKRRYKNIDINFDGYLVVAITKEKSMSQEATTIVANYAKDNKKAFKDVLKAFKNESNRALDALSNNDFNKLRSTLNSNQMLLEDIGVSDYNLEQLLQVATQAGASAAKISGSGIGGSIIALSKNYDIAKTIDLKLREQGVKATYIINLNEI